MDYTPETGELAWRVDPPRKKGFVGRVVGTRVSAGYLSVCIDGTTYLAHRLAWLHTHGRWPDGQIDHVNGDRTDNRLSNLRDVEQRVNLQNRRTVRGSKKSSALLGVFPAPSKKNPWASSIRVDRKKVHIGVFPTEEAAHAAYVEAKRRLHAGCTI
jgi:hypothetical protein